MREITVQHGRNCVKCHEWIEAGQAAIQSESRFGDMWHLDCAPPSMYIKWRPE